MILVYRYDLFLPNFAGHDSTADSSNIKQANVCFFRILIVFFLYFSLNLRHKWMPNILCGMQTKLSRTMGVPIRYNGRNDKFTVPLCLFLNNQ